MFLKRGNYSHGDGEARFTFTKESQFADNNVLVGSTSRVRIRGMKTGTDASDLSAKMLAMEAAYAAQTGNWEVFDGSNSLACYKLEGSKAIGGIRLVRFDYQMPDPAELTTYVHYDIELEANFGGVGVIGGGTPGQSTMLTWSESLSVRGNGGPRFVLRELRNGPPQKQIASQRTPVFASQRGEAVGLYNWPSPAQPIWPQHVSAPDMEVSRTSAMSVGGTGYQQQRREYRVTWNYTFQAMGPLTANPNSGY